MARLNVQGVALAKEICARLDVPYRQCGSLVLALSQAELPHLQKLYANGVANGVPGIRLLAAEETLTMGRSLPPQWPGRCLPPAQPSSVRGSLRWPWRRWLCATG